MASSNLKVTVADGVEIVKPKAGQIWAVGAVVLNKKRQAFAQKRSADRPLFPDCWDIVGGHLEDGESLIEALARELKEETGWTLVKITRFLGITSWNGHEGKETQEADYLVEVEGDLTKPALEWSKHSTFDWFSLEDVERLKENRKPGEFLIHDLVLAALSG